MDRAGCELWHEHTQKIEVETRLEGLKLDLIDLSLNEIIIWDSNVLLTRILCTFGIFIPHSNLFLMGQRDIKAKTFVMWRKMNDIGMLHPPP